jgi:methylenetetrahydrofolate dehydrogenase (NADP+)/methenyltetrahydrofolate cyclohydrolase
MSAKIMDGKMIASEIREQLKKDVASIVANGGQRPRLAVVLCGDDHASKVYVGMKEKACAEVGIHSEIHHLGPETTQNEVMDLIQKLNYDKTVSGILIQLPLFKHINQESVIRNISPLKDVDGVHPENVGLLWNRQDGLFPCTPLGCIEILKRYGVELKGKKAVVVGASNIVGRPMASFLLREACTVTVCHRFTENLVSETRNADILIVAVGKPGLITANMIKPGATVIDVGINRLGDGSIVGDVDFATAKDVAGVITPVPGGVGPMTIATLLQNTIKAASR